MAKYFVIQAENFLSHFPWYLSIYGNRITIIIPNNADNQLTCSFHNVSQSQSQSQSTSTVRVTYRHIGTSIVNRTLAFHVAQPFYILFKAITRRFTQRCLVTSWYTRHTLTGFCLWQKRPISSDEFFLRRFRFLSFLVFGENKRTCVWCKRKRTHFHSSFKEKKKNVLQFGATMLTDGHTTSTATEATNTRRKTSTFRIRLENSETVEIDEKTHWLLAIVFSSMFRYLLANNISHKDRCQRGVLS